MSDPTSLPNFPPPADEHPLRGRVLDVLKDLGLNPNIDGDGDVAFMIGEPPQQLFVRCLDGDWPVMRIFGQWLIGEQVPDDLYLRLQRCNDFSLQLNLAKVGIAHNNLVVSVEHVVTMQTDISALFQISVNLIMEVVQMWHASFQTPPQGADGVEGTNGSNGVVGGGDPSSAEGGPSSAGEYRPRHRPQDDA